MAIEAEALRARLEKYYRERGGVIEWQRQEVDRLMADNGPLSDLIHRSALAEDTARAVEGQIPEGWKLVPVEPTDRMTFVGQSVRYNDEWGIGAIYRHMLAAAPALPLTKEDADANR